jgi:hypothetical protein
MKSSNRSLSSFSLLAASMRSLYVRLSGERSWRAAWTRSFGTPARSARRSISSRAILPRPGTVGSAR